jgi:hypothetical protein
MFAAIERDAAEAERGHAGDHGPAKIPEELHTESLLKNL